MTSVALGGCRYVRRALGLRILSNESAAVTGGTVACRYRRIRAGMAHDAGSEGGEAVHVADVALRAGRNMGSRLAQRIDGQIRTGMAGCALASQSGVIHPCRLEGRVIRMAGITLGAGGNMHGRLAEHRCAVVAA